MQKSDTQIDQGNSISVVPTSSHRARLPAKEAQTHGLLQPSTNTWQWTGRQILSQGRFTRIALKCGQNYTMAPSVVISVLGNELLSLGHHSESMCRDKDGAHAPLISHFERKCRKLSAAPHSGFRLGCLLNQVGPHNTQQQRTKKTQSNTWSHHILVRLGQLQTASLFGARLDTPTVGKVCKNISRKSSCCGSNLRLISVCSQTGTMRHYATSQSFQSTTTR